MPGGGRIALATIIGAAVASLLPSGPGSPSEAASLRHLWIAPTGSWSSNCSRTQPCRTLDRAFRLAAPGQVVELLSGAYPAQSIDSHAKTSGRNVVFRPAAGARARFTGRLTLNGADHLTLSRLRLADIGPSDRSLFIESCTTDVKLNRVSGETFFIMEGAGGITFAGGRWGGYSTPGEEDSAIGTSGALGPTNWCGGKPAKPAGPILFDRVTFHDVFWGVPSGGWGGSHPDCFEINGYVNHVTVRRSRFVRCASTFMQINPDQGHLRNVTFERNRFVHLGDDSWYGIMITSEGKPALCGNLVFRRNTYLPMNPGADTWPNGPLRTDCDVVSGTARVKVTRNLFTRAPASWDCNTYRRSPWLTKWSDNMFRSGSCGPGSRHIPFGYRLGSRGLEVTGDARAVRLIFSLAARGAGFTTIRRALRRAGLDPPGDRWNSAAMRTIVSRRAYVGGLYGAPGSHPGLVSPSRWLAAQRLV